MSPRLAGAALALIAAALLAMSIVTSAWWAGHPEVEGRTIEAKTVHVGLHGAEGCNTGGDDRCTTLDMPGGFTATGYAEAGVASLLAIAAVLLAIATLRMTEGRKQIASIVFVLTALAVLVAIALIVQGPKVKASQHVALPIGYGLFLFAGGAIAAVVAGGLARRPAPKLALRPSRAAIGPAAQQPVDVLALIQDDGLRPSAPIASTPLPGPAGPLGVSQSQPLFNAAPQLRALYDADPKVGGTAGYVPGVAPQLPTSAPTPIPRANLSALAGIPTPAPLAPPEPPRPVTTQGPAAMPLTSPRPKPPTAAPPPPPRTNPPPFGAAPPRTSPASVPPPPRSAPPTAPPPVAGTNPPPAPRARAGTQPPPPGAIAARLKASSVPPPVRPASVAVPPAPTTPKTLAGTPAPPIVAAKLPVRAETDPSELAETVDRDAASVGDATDASVVLPPESELTSPSEPLDTEEGPVVRPPTNSDDVETAAREKVEAEVARESMSEIATVARERVSSHELETGDSTAETAAENASAVAAPVPAPAPAPVVAEAPKIPITTAPSTLPPPKDKQVATSGPSPACPQCEAPMAWVEEHLRFYCKSCRMYF